MLSIESYYIITHLNYVALYQRLFYFIKKCTRYVKHIMQTTHYLYHLQCFWGSFSCKRYITSKLGSALCLLCKNWSSLQIPHLCVHHGTVLCGFFFLLLLGFALTSQCVNRTPHYSFESSLGQGLGQYYFEM